MDRLNEGFTLLMDGMRQFADGIRLMAEGMEALNTRLVNIERWATIRFQTPRRYVVIGSRPLPSFSHLFLKYFPTTASSPGTPYGIPIAMSGWTPTPPAYHPATPQAPVRPRRQMGICSRGRRGRRGGVGANIRPISPTWSQREQPLSVASSTCKKKFFYCFNHILYF
jgi:hypothetical protein